MPDEVLDGAPFGFVSFRDDGTITDVNETALGLLGYARGELLGRPFEQILTLGARIFHQTHFFPLVSLHGRADEIYLTLRPKSGEPVGVLANALRRERGGAPVIDCAFLWVRERERFEDELVRARRAADEARRTVEAQAAELRRANALLEAQAAELEEKQRRLEEHALEVELQSEELQAQNDLLLEQSEELERQRARAEEASRAKSAFLAVTSHELRTPLNAIGGYVQLLEMEIHGPVTDAQREALGRIDRSQRHLLRLINDVLNLARIEAGRVEYHLEDLSLADVVASVTPMVEPQMASRGLAFEVRLPAGDVVRADREKVQQIVLNLLGNAVKFTPEGGRVVVDAEGRAGAPEHAFLRVTDTGPGIPAEMLESIFQPFVQVGQGPARAEGSGLGLAISRDLARGMGGDLRARSVPGQGSTFTLALPRVSAPAGDAGADPAPTTAAHDA
jgi:PAS domain S-box-containing protein